MTCPSLQLHRSHPHMELILSTRNTKTACRIAMPASSCKTICYYGNRWYWTRPQFNQEQELIIRGQSLRKRADGPRRALEKHGRDDISVRTCTLSGNRVIVFVLASLSVICYYGAFAKSLCQNVRCCRYRLACVKKTV